MKPLPASTLVASHRSLDEYDRSMRPATISNKNSLVALAAPARIVVQNRKSCGKCGEKNDISWGSSGVPPVILAQRCPAITCVKSLRIQYLEPVYASHNVAGHSEIAL
jgi:hypothetical protein